MSRAFDVLPVTLVTGFLGSGKSTLLADMLHGDAARDTAVLVNEFGEVGLDHLLIGEIDVQTVLLDNGCVCCSIRGELKDALVDLFSRRVRGEVPAFARVVIETTGLATPAPIVATLLADPMVRTHFRLDATVTVVDAVHAMSQRARQPEWLAQISAADRLVITKADRVDRDALDALAALLADLNPAAQIGVRRGRAGLESRSPDGASVESRPLIDALFSPSSALDLISRLGHAQGRRVSLAGTTRDDAGDAGGVGDPGGVGEGYPGEADPGDGARDVLGRRVHGDPGVTHAARAKLMHRRSEPDTRDSLRAFAIEIDAPLDWSVFTLWFTMLLNRHGDKILRVKGVLSIAGAAQPAVLHAVQHLVHPVTHLEAWPSAITGGAAGITPRSQLVFITEGLEREAVEASYTRFVSYLEDTAH